jgi:hypothetical protein
LKKKKEDKMKKLEAEEKHVKMAEKENNVKTEVRWKLRIKEVVEEVLK